MILGIGSDLCDVRRIERALERFGGRFVERVFTEGERGRSDRLSGQARAGSYAKRFAAKEAGAKALGTGIQGGVFLTDLEVVNLPGGRPVLQLNDGAAARLAAITPPGMRAQVHLTMTDEYPYAYAHVIISAVPDAAEPPIPLA